MAYIAEYTDTFGGEANYCWVRRATLEMDEPVSDLALVRRAKRELGISGLKGRTYKHGDIWEFRPHRMCCVMFIYACY